MPQLSPHLFVYKFPITAISSITARLTGLGCSAAYLSLGLAGLCGCEKAALKAYKELPPWQRYVPEWAFLFAGTYHSLAGIRHLVWDANPQLLVTPKVARSSYLLFGAAAGISSAVHYGLFYGR